MVILELIHAEGPDLFGRDVFIRSKNQCAGSCFGGARLLDDSW